jgi:hypothetical protein
MSVECVDGFVRVAPGLCKWAGEQVVTKPKVWEINSVDVVILVIVTIIAFALGYLSYRP